MLQMRHCQEGRIWDIASHSCSGNQHEESGDVDLIGPFCELSVPVASGSTRPSTRSVEVVVFDLDMDGASHITATLPEGVEDQAVKSFGLYRGTRVPLLEAAANFLTTGGDRLQGYVTARSSRLQVKLQMVPAQPTLRLCFNSFYLSPRSLNALFQE